MANSDLARDNGGGLASLPREYKTWVLALMFSAALLVGLGIWLAAVTGGVAKPWTGAAFVVAMGLALVVGASKTSSA